MLNVHWSIGLLVYWFIGLLFHWSIVPLVRWSIGPLVHWSIGPLDHWSIGWMSNFINQMSNVKCPMSIKKSFVGAYLWSSSGHFSFLPCVIMQSCVIFSRVRCSKHHITKRYQSQSDPSNCSTTVLHPSQIAFLCDTLRYFLSLIWRWVHFLWSLLSKTMWPNPLMKFQPIMSLASLSRRTTRNNAEQTG